MTIANDGKVKVPSSIHTSDSTSLAVQDINGTAVGFGQLYLNRDDTATVDQVVFGKNGAQVGKIQTTGTGTLYNTGGAGGGIDFSGTSQTSATGASMSSELLDDYEEGTWTPDLQFGTASSGITYNDRGGRYTKIGDTVHVIFRCYLSNKGSATGHARLSGFPFSIASVTGGVFQLLPSRGQLGSNDEAMHLYMDSSYGTAPKFYKNDWDGSGNITSTNLDFQNNSEIECCFTYFTNS
jgi:hypothetical protein